MGSVDELIRHQNETEHNDCEWRDGAIYCHEVTDEEDRLLKKGDIKIDSGDIPIQGKKHFESLSTCGRCGADIMFALYLKTNNTSPLDALPNQAEGRIQLDVHAMTYIILKLPEVAVAIERGEPLYTSHMATCKVLIEERRKKAQ